MCQFVLFGKEMVQSVEDDGSVRTLVENSTIEHIICKRKKMLILNKFLVLILNSKTISYFNS